MKKTAYLLLDEDEGYAPRYVYESKDIAESLSAVTPYSVVEVAYYVPEADTWERVLRDCETEWEKAIVNRCIRLHMKEN